MKKLLKRIIPEFLIQTYLLYFSDIIPHANILSKKTGISRLTLLFDMGFSILRFVTPYEYGIYCFYERSWRARNQFVTLHRRKKLVKALNHGDRQLFNNKQLFYRHFSDFIGRQWLYASDASDLQIEDFFYVQKQIIVKPSNLSGGTGVRKILYSDVTDMKVFCETARKECWLLEEFVKQHPGLSAINPASVNTMRINTVMDREGVRHVLHAALRMGRGQSIIDNLSGGGIVAQIDLHSGILSTLAIGKDLQYHIKHPTSGVVLPGFQIPHWKVAKEMVLQAAKLVPQTRWIAWDVAVVEDGPIVIEGNATGPGHELMQLPSQKGIYHLFREYL